MSLLVLTYSFIASLVYLNVGIIQAWPATALPSIRSLLGSVSIEQTSWIGSASNMGALAGTMMSWVVTSRVSARVGLCVTSVGMLSGWSLVLLASWLNLIVLVFPGLVIIGLAIGMASPLASIYITEISGDQSKGVLSSMFNFNLTFGILMSYVIGSLTSWFITSMALVGLNLVMCFLMFLLSPTPHEAVRNNEMSQVPIIISKLTGKEEGDPEVEEEMEKVIKKIQTEVAGGVSLKQRLERINIKNLIILVIVFLMSQLSGITVVTSYNVDIFQSVPVSEFIILLVAGLSEMTFSFFQMVIANKLGRKTFLIISTLGCSISMLGFAAIFWVPDQTNLDEILVSVVTSNGFIIGCVAAYLMAYNLGIGPIKHTLLSELFSPEDQKFVAGMCHWVYWMATFSCNKIFHFLVSEYGLTNMFLSISVIMFLSCVFTCLFVPETRPAAAKHD